jgi:hypothetical protein
MVVSSPINSYSDTTPHKRIITDVISLIDPSDAPMINALGGLDGAAGKFRFVNGEGTTVEWLEDTLYPLADALNGSIASNATTITVDTGAAFKEGDILLIGAEQLWVSAIAANVLTVTRGIAGTTAATAADNAVVEIVGQARLEGDDSDDRAFTDKTVGTNVTQILHEEVKVSRTMQQVSQYGISNEMAYQGDKLIPSLMRLLEKHTFRNGAADAGSATTPRIMGGLGAFITDNTVSGASLAQSQFENAVKAAYSDGGSGPWLAPVHPDNYQKIKNFYDSSAYLRIDRTENTVGMVIDKIETPFGNVNLLLDRWAPSGTIFLIDVDNAGFKTLYPFTQEPLAKDGDYDKSEIVGEFTLCVRQDKSHAKLTSVS